MRLKRRVAASAACESRVCAFHARASFRSARGARERARCGPAKRRDEVDHVVQRFLLFSKCCTAMWSNVRSAVSAP
eukprot:173151-Lingulodinium_polyedra.AAC.1